MDDLRLDLSRLAAALHDAPIGHTIAYRHSTPSTMPLARQLARLPATRSGTLVVTEEQTAGRGRLDRRWEAPPGQALLVSLILRSPVPGELAQLPMRSALAIIQAVEECCPVLAGLVGLKWPNDVLLGHTLAAAGKVAGILIESEWQAGRLDHAVVGIGINVNQLAGDLPPGQPGAPPPTSIRLWTPGQATQDRTALLVALCRALGERLFDRTTEQSWADWRQRLWVLGQEVQIFTAGQPVWEGRAEEVAADGTLTVVGATGEARTFLAGEVTLRLRV